MPITHEFVSPKDDLADDTLVQPSDWNDNHDIQTTAKATPVGADKILIKDTEDSDELAHVTFTALLVFLALGDYQLRSEKGIANGYVPLDEDGFIPDALHSSLIATIFNVGAVADDVTALRDDTEVYAEQVFQIACGGKEDDVIVADDVINFPIPFDIEILDIFTYVSEAGTGAGSIEVDVELATVTIFTTKPIIAADERTSITGTNAVIDTNFLDRADILVVNVLSTTATPPKGLQMHVVYRRRLP